MCVCVCVSVCVCDIVVENHDRSNLADCLERSSLHVAVGKGNLYVSCYLIDRGDDANIPFTG